MAGDNVNKRFRRVEMIFYGSDFKSFHLGAAAWNFDACGNCFRGFMIREMQSRRNPDSKILADVGTNARRPIQESCR